MRHNKKNNHLVRKKAHRGAMLSNMANSLIMHKRIFTTVPKAKELRKFVEPIITKSKEDTTTSRRLVFKKLQSKQAVTELFQNISQKVADRPGGYTRIIKTGFRLGDNASMCFIELVDYNENMLKESGAKKARTRRSRRKSTSTATAAKATAPATKEEEPNAKAAKEKGVEPKEKVAKETKETKETQEASTKKSDKEATPTEKKAIQADKKVEAEKETQKEKKENAEDTPSEG